MAISPQEAKEAAKGKEISLIGSLHLEKRINQEIIECVKREDKQPFCITIKGIYDYEIVLAVLNKYNSNGWAASHDEEKECFYFKEAN